MLALCCEFSNGSSKPVQAVFWDSPSEVTRHAERASPWTLGDLGSNSVLYLTSLSLGPPVHLFMSMSSPKKWCKQFPGQPPTLELTGDHGMSCPNMESSFLRQRYGCGRKDGKEKGFEASTTLLGPVQRQMWYNFPAMHSPLRCGAEQNLAFKLDSLFHGSLNGLFWWLNSKSVCFWVFFSFTLDISSKFSLWIVSTANTS